MWNRKDLKEKARKNFFKNYWFCLAICFLLGFMCYEYSSSFSNLNAYKGTEINNEENVNVALKKTNLEFINLDTGTFKDQVVEVVSDEQAFIFKLAGSIKDFIEYHYIEALSLFLAFALGFLYQFLFAYPFTVGSRKFFLENHENDKTKIKMVLFPFRKNNNYFNTVKVMFFRYIYLVLWTFTIIGLPIKLYEYKMIPFILADNPKLSKKEVFALSKKMMYGNKWKAFVLDLSFIGWSILDAITIGLSGIFYSNPYHLATYTELYIKLKKC